jgi:hypothetical protein
LGELAGKKILPVFGVYWTTRRKRPKISVQDIYGRSELERRRCSKKLSGDFA